MKTPVCDFVNEYIGSNAQRLHMPGHKGCGALGFEAYDITEISGADSLFEADGIIKESEENAGRLFGCKTFYSAEGSSQCIRAMVHLAVLHAKKEGKSPLIAAGRNAHKSFMSALALTDCDVKWLTGGNSYLSCKVTAESLENAIITGEKPTAVYITSPDYLGNIADLKAISHVCKSHGILLLVDNAHGAYLKFLPESLHPTDMGADICCDSAHKTLPVLTGGAYLHISEKADPFFAENAKTALSLYCSTSPSYLILQSLDAANRYIDGGYAEKLRDFCEKTAQTKARLIAHGFTLYGDEPLKITLCAKKYGYYGEEIANILQKKNIHCEFSDPDFIVFMVTPETEESGLLALENALVSIEKRSEIEETPPDFVLPERVTSVREAVFSQCETIPASESLGRILAAANVACPPAVPVAVCGERINEEIIRCFEYYGIKECKVIRSAR